MHHPTDRIAHTTAFVIAVVEHWLEREWDEAKYIDLQRLRCKGPRKIFSNWAHHFLAPALYVCVCVCVCVCDLIIGMKT